MKQVVCLLALCVTALLSVWLVTESQKKSGVIDAIEARRSIRVYKDTPVEREKLQLLAECGVLAPSAMNRQEWELRIVDSKEWIDGCSAAYLEKKYVIQQYLRYHLLYGADTVYILISQKQLPESGAVCFVSYCRKHLFFIVLQLYTITFSQFFLVPNLVRLVIKKN